MKVCSICKTSKNLTEFHKKGSDKVRSCCKYCYISIRKSSYLRSIDKSKNYYVQNKEIILNKEKEYRKNNSEKIKARSKLYRANNTNKIQEYKKLYQNTENYKSTHRAKKKAYKKRVRQSTPEWVNMEDIINFYKNCPEGHHVDHIVPLKGKNISGLHVLWNLQYLTAEDNIKKSNKF